MILPWLDALVRREFGDAGASEIDDTQAFTLHHRRNRYPAQPLATSGSFGLWRELAIETHAGRGLVASFAR